MKLVNGESTREHRLAAVLRRLTPSGGVNRVVVRCFEDQIRVNVNGTDVFDIKDGTFRKGRVGIGAIAFGPPPTVSSTTSSSRRRPRGSRPPRS